VRVDERPSCSDAATKCAVASFHSRNGDDKNDTEARDEPKPMIAPLADLLAPVSTREFLEVFRAKKRLHIMLAGQAAQRPCVSRSSVSIIVDAVHRSIRRIKQLAVAIEREMESKPT
jgi:hypothetical protein